MKRASSSSSALTVLSVEKQQLAIIHKQVTGSFRQRTAQSKVNQRYATTPISTTSKLLDEIFPHQRTTRPQYTERRTQFSANVLIVGCDSTTAVPLALFTATWQSFNSMLCFLLGGMIKILNNADLET